MTPNEPYWICAQTGVTPLAIGMPGVAKTASIYAFARAVNRRVYTLIASLRDPADIGGYPYPAETTIGANGTTAKVPTMQLLAPKWAVDCCNSEKWIVFFDEATTCSPACQAALLRVIAEKVVGDTPLPEDTWILAAANPPEQAANGIELEAAMANRLYHHPWEVDWSAWHRGMMAGLQFPEPSFPVLPEGWRDLIGATGGLVSAFLKRKPGLGAAFPDDRSQASGPWPSPRTWAHAAVCLAAAQSVDAGKAVEHALVAGLVGEAAALEFSKWREELDLPDPEFLLNTAMAAMARGGEMLYVHPDRPDKVLAMLSSVVAAVLGDNTSQRWEAGMAVMERASRHDKELAAASAANLTCKIPPGARMNPEFARRVFPTIKQALVA